MNRGYVNSAVCRPGGLLALVCALLWSACDLTGAPPSDNVAPNTTLSNIPVENDTLFALVTLHWDGEDEDGFPAYYEYRYTTRHLFMGDSVVTAWDTTQTTSLTLAFESSDELNQQVFEVRAVDNNGVADPTPATRAFYTLKTIFPETEIIGIEADETFFVLDAVTDWWQGIPLTFTAIDQDGDVVEYAWAVDDGDWNWTQDTTLFLPPDAFSGSLQGEHTLRVTSRDNTNLVDPVGDEISIRLISPTFAEEILIIDETLERSMPFGVAVTDEQVDQYYADLFGTTNTWDYATDGMPSKEVLGRYQLVIWHADNNFSNPTDYHKLPLHTDVISDYMNVGGDFIMSGWRILKSFAPTEDMAAGVSFAPGTFINDYLHITAASETSLAGDFTSATGVGDFSSVRVDSLKLASAFPYYGRLAQINVIDERAGFTEFIYAYEGETLSLRGRPIGLRYYGTTFNAVVLGFPLFFMRKEDAARAASEVLQALGYAAPSS
jgi:hypothetical protein